MPHQNRFGQVRRRHDDLGFGKSHHLRGTPDQPGPEGDEVVSGGAEGGAILVVEQGQQQVAEKTAADLTPYRVDQFDVEPTLVAVSGGSVSVASGGWYHENRDPETGAFSSFGAATAGTYAGFTAVVGSNAAKYSWGHTSRPAWSTCTGISYTMAGAAHASWWQQVTVNSAPAGGYDGIWVGPNLSLSASQTWLIGKRIGVYVKATAPTQNGDGTLVYTRTIAAADLTGSYLDLKLFVPAASVPVGTTVWVGICPIDLAQEGIHFCSLSNVLSSGAYDSWAASYSQTRTTTFNGFDFTALTGWHGLAYTDGWFYGNLPWAVTPTDGKVTFSSGLVFTPTAATNGSLVLQMDGVTDVDMPDDFDDPAGEPWTEEDGVRMLLRFKVSAVGSLVDAGTRAVTLEWNDGGGAVSAIAHLGDTADAAGIEISGDGLTDQVAKAIAADTYYWLWLDSRNPNKLRAKLFEDLHPAIPLLFAGEPPDPDVEIDRVLGYEGTVDNYLKLTVNAGNASGQQAVTLSHLYVIGPAHDGELVEEYVGEGDGAATTFYASMSVKPGSLSTRAWGHVVRSAEVDPEYGSFVMVDALPVPDAAPMVAAYECDRAEDFDDDTEYAELDV